MDRDSILVLEIVNSYKYNSQLKRYSDRHFFNDNSIFSSIKSKEDIKRYENHVVTCLSQCNKIYPLEKEDIIDLEQAMGRYEIAVRKALQLYNNEAFKSSAEELQALIDKLFSYHEEVQNISFRKMIQD
ncbi:hypothetical protein [Paenibacillus massiliensis]|uniref:hypothetical protein n=1 Tax=Paenibacillus massiliensis TaxID=225917 RepID=UPI00048EF961|nr:hypothetical protein [Paenibacillus massiliensis]